MNKCPHCGKEHAEEVKFCSACGKEMKAVVGIDKAVMVEAFKEAVTPMEKSINEKIGGIDERLKKIEAQPVEKGAPSIIIPEVFKGYNLSDQGEAIRERVRGKSFKISDGKAFGTFQKFIILISKVLRSRGQDQESMNDLNQLAKSTGLDSAVDAQGGYTVPDIFQADMIKLAREDSFALREATVIPMASDVMKVPSEVSLVSAYWVATKTKPTESDPVFGQVTLTAKKLFGLTNPVGNELIADSSFDIVSLLTEQFAYAIGQEYDNQYLNGTGDPVSGVLTAKAGYSVVLGTGKTNFSSVVAADFRAMIKKLSSKDAVNGKFVYSKDIQYLVDTLVDTTGRFIYRAPGDPTGPGKLWGRNVIESSKGPLDASSAASTAFGVFGDLKQFYIGVRKGSMSIDIDPYTNFDTDETAFRMITRTAMNVARATAFCRILTAAE